MVWGVLGTPTPHPPHTCYVYISTRPDPVGWWILKIALAILAQAVVSLALEDLGADLAKCWAVHSNSLSYDGISLPYQMSNTLVSVSPFYHSLVQNNLITII